MFVIVLENEDAADTFGNAAKSPYLARRLTEQGEFIPNYYGTTHFSLGNYIAMVSGQSSNPQTQADCLFYTEMLPGTIGPDGQAVGQGCVYPAAVKTVADQLERQGPDVEGLHGGHGQLADRAQDLPPPRDRRPGRHPEGAEGRPVRGPPQPLRLLPLDHRHAGLRGQRRPARPAPGRPGVGLDDAQLRLHHAQPCATTATTRRASTASPAAWSPPTPSCSLWVPRILSSPAYRQDGLLIVTFDEAGSGAESCCNQPAGPNTPNPGGPEPGGGGGKTGAVALSPWIRPGTINSTPYNHYSLLRSVEDIFGLEHLGYAARPGLRPFGSEFFTGTGPGKPRRCGDRAVRRGRNGRILRGNVIQQPRIRRGVLSVRFRHRARLSVTVRPARGRGRATRLRSRVVLSCRTYRIALPHRHGLLDLRARPTGAGFERRLIRF